MDIYLSVLYAIFPLHNQHMKTTRNHMQDKNGVVIQNSDSIKTMKIQENAESRNSRGKTRKKKKCQMNSKGKLIRKTQKNERSPC